MRKWLKNEKGLTLVELLAVIVILGIVAAIAVPTIGSIIQKSKVNAVEADAIQILNAAKTYVADNEVPSNGTISATQLGDYISDSEITNYSVSTDGKEFKLSAATVEAGNATITFNNATIQNIKDNTKYKGTFTVSGTTTIQQ